MIKKYLIGSEFRRNVLTLLTGTTIAQAISIAISPILTRMYSPEDFGLLAIYISIVTIVSTIVTGAYEFAIVLPKQEKHVIPLIQLSFFINIFITIVTVFIISYFHNEILILLNNSDIDIWLYFIPLSIFFMGVFQTLTFWLNRHKYYNDIALTKITQSGMTVTSQLIIGLTGLISGGLLLGRIIGQFFSTYIILRIFFTKKRILVNRFYKIKILALAKRYKKFPLYEAWSNFLNTSSTEIPIILITSLFSIKVAGFYALANRMLLLPLSLIGSSIGQVFLQKASANKSDIQVLTKITKSIYSKLVFIGTIPISIIMIYGDLIFSFIFGLEWKVAGEFSQLLALWLLVVFITSPLSNLLIVLEKQKESLYFNILIFLSRISSIFIGFLLFNDAYKTVAIFGVVGAFFWIFWCSYILKLVNISLFWALFEVLKILLPAIFILSLIREIIL